jgi:GTP cyclohydrolase II
MADYRIASTKLDTIYGEFDFHCFAWGEHEEDHILCLKRATEAQDVLVRLQSACYTAEIFRSRDCDCHEQLHSSLEKIAHEGGLLIYMLCDGRGAGLYQKVKGLELGRTRGLDTSDAYHELGLEQDPRTYDRAVQVLRYFNISTVRLLTNNPRKLKGLEMGGLAVTRVPLEITATPESFPYLETKKNKMGHMLTLGQPRDDRAPRR